MPFGEQPLIHILDDDEATCELLGTFCELEGYRVRCFGRGIDLLVAAAEERPTLILLDVMMADIDGFRLCRALKGNPQTASIRVLLMSGLARPADYQTARRVGADAYLAKPLDLDVLGELLACHLEASQDSTETFVEELGPVDPRARIAIDWAHERQGSSRR